MQVSTFYYWYHRLHTNRKQKACILTHTLAIMKTQCSHTMYILYTQYIGLQSFLEYRFQQIYVGLKLKQNDIHLVAGHFYCDLSRWLSCEGRHLQLSHPQTGLQHRHANQQITNTAAGLHGHSLQYTERLQPQQWPHHTRPNVTLHN